MCQHFQHPDLPLGEGAIPPHALTRQILGALPCIQLLQCPSWHFSTGGGGKEEQQHGKCHMGGLLGQSQRCRCPGGWKNVGVLSKSQGTKNWDSLSSSSWIQPLSGKSVPWVLGRGLEGWGLGARPLAQMVWQQLGRSSLSRATSFLPLFKAPGQSLTWAGHLCQVPAAVPSPRTSYSSAPALL